jgi:hypothetical protein
MTDFTYIQTTHKTINKTVVRELAQMLPNAVRRSNIKTIDGVKVLFVYDSEGNKLGWADKSPLQNVKLTIKN